MGAEYKEEIKKIIADLERKIAILDREIILKQDKLSELSLLQHKLEIVISEGGGRIGTAKDVCKNNN